MGFTTSPNSPKPVFSHFVRQVLLILCVSFSLAAWCCSECYGQLADARSRQLRNDRETRSTSPALSAQATVQEMQSSLRKIPWNELSPAAQAKIKRVTAGAPLFRRLPQQTVYADQEIFQFLLRHPDLVIGFWEHWGATQLSLREVKENHYVLKETTGTVAAVEVLYRSNDLCIVYAKGEYRGPLIAKPYQGEVILVLQTQFVRDHTNEPMIVCDLDSFVQINSLGADVLAKLFFTSIAKVADSNFEVTVSFISQVSKAASQNTTALKNSAEEVSTIRQDVCAEFCNVVDRVAVRFARRNQPVPFASKEREMPKTAPDLALSELRAPSEWGMDHFHDSPLPPYAEVHDEGVLSAPKPVGANFSGNTVPFAVPKLPRPEK